MLYRPDIDGLRAVAVLLVVFFHCGFQEISGGFVGVDIFFVISGFLITGIIYREAEREDFTYVSFYVRRIKRIGPALFLTLAVCAVVSFFCLIPQDLRVFGRSLVSAVFFYANWHFYTQVGYFDAPAIEKPLLHTWSLAVEEQFYLVWPALFLGLFRLVRRSWLPHALAGLILASLIASQLVLATDPAQVFYLLPYRMWELLLGAFIAVAPFPVLSHRSSSLFGIAGFGAVFYAAFFFTNKTPFPGLNALFPCVGAALLILAGARKGSLTGRVLSLHPLRFIGKISYSLYLFHWPIFSFFYLVRGEAPNLTERLTIIAVSIAASALSWRFVEAPARRATIGLPRLAIGTVSAALVLAGCGIVYHASMGLPLRVPAGVRDANLASAGNGAGECRNDPVPDLPTGRCPIGMAATEMQYDFVVWGDSHAGHLPLVFSEQAAARGLAGIVISSGGCGPFIRESRVPLGCSERVEKTAAWLATQKRLKAIFLAGIWTVYAETGLLAVPAAAEIDRKAVATCQSLANCGLAGTLQFLHSLKANVIIVEDTPFFPLKVAPCAARARMFGRSDEHCFILERQEFDSKTKRASAILREISLRFGIPLLETAQAFCQGDVCRAERDGIIFYRDETHLNPAGARYLGSQLQIPWPLKDTKTAGTVALRE